ncbi:hypothetical protein BZA77DRAFT_360732 [Pyronema omphalodes]|nr:hypothetical protein BZA77DRAFT_360732 [Pyronema omphalodes]
MPSSSMLAKAKIMRENAKLKVQSSRTFRKIKSAFGISSPRDKGKAPAIPAEDADAKVSPQPSLASESSSQMRLPYGSRYYDENQGPSSLTWSSFSIGGLSPLRGSFENGSFQARDDGYTGIGYSSGQGLAGLTSTDGVNADDSCKENLYGEEIQPQVHALTIKKSTTMTAGGKSPFPRLDSINRAPVKSATMSVQGKTSFPRFSDLASGQAPRSSTAYPGTATPIASTASPQRVVEESFSRVGTTPTPLRRVQARLNLIEEPRNGSSPSLTFTSRPSALRHTGPSTSPVVERRGEAHDSMDSIQASSEDDASVVTAFRVEGSATVNSGSASPVGNARRRVSRVLVPVEDFAENDEEEEKVVSGNTSKHLYMHKNHMLFSDERVVSYARDRPVRSQTVVIPERKSSLGQNMAAGYGHRKLSMQTSSPLGLDIGARGTPMISRKDPSRASTESTFKDTPRKDFRFHAPALGEAKEDEKKPRPSVSTTMPPPVSTPSRIPRSSSAVATGILSATPESRRRVTEDSSHSIHHSISRVMNAPSSSFRPVSLFTTRQETPSRASTSVGKSSIPISLSMAATIKSTEKAYTSKDATKTKNVWSSRVPVPRSATGILQGPQRPVMASGVRVVASVVNSTAGNTTTPTRKSRPMSSQVFEPRTPEAPTIPQLSLSPMQPPPVSVSNAIYTTSTDSDELACDSDTEEDVPGDKAKAKTEAIIRDASNTLKVEKVSNEVFRKNSVGAREEAARTERTVLMPGSYPSWMESRDNVRGV